MKAIQTICGEYEAENIFNMDETALFWRRSPSGGLSTQTIPGQKKDKSRVSLIICTNATGTQRLHIWVIGQSARPRALRSVNIEAMELIWKSNKKAWMNSTIMRQWLRAFYASVGTTRSILLLLDNLRAHITGVEQEPPPPNVRIQFLPANSTSLYQPLDQGIIQNLKVYYRKAWLEFILQKYEELTDPMKFMDIHLALRWLSYSWKNCVTNATIYACFRKSTIITQPVFLPLQAAPNLHSVYHQIEAITQIKNRMNLQNFLHPTDEEVYDKPIETEDEIMAVVLQEHLQPEFEEEAEEDFEWEEIQPVPTPAEAAAAILLLQRFYEYQEEATASDIQSINRLVHKTQLIQRSLLHQGTLDRWII